MKSNRFVAMVLIPALMLLTLFVVIPIIGSFIISLFDYSPLRSTNQFLGFDNYKRLFEENIYKTTLRNTIVFVFVTVAVNIALSLVLANFISSLKRKWFRNLILVCVFLPCVAPIANSAIVWGRSIFAQNSGLLNMMLSPLGIQSIDWIGSNSPMLLTSLIIFTVWVDIGYNAILFTAGVDGIPHDLYEAASIDGVGPFQRFFRITVPLLGRIMMFILPMTLISHFQMFAQFEILAGRIGRGGQVLTTYIYNTGFRTYNMGFASAIAVSLFVLILLVTVLQRRLSKVDWEY